MGEIVIPDSEIARVSTLLGLLPYQRRLLRRDARFTWNCWARQTGKSYTLSLRRVMRGMRRRQTQLFLSAGMRQTHELMLKVRQHCHLLNIEASEVKGEGSDKLQASATQIRLPGGVRLIGLPAKPETIRGFTGDVLLDEFTMHQDDRAIWAAIFPTILRGRGELDVASTPKGKDNLFYNLRKNLMFARSTVSLPQAIEQGLEIDIETLRQAMGCDELFRQEFLCEFLDESQAFLPYRVIAACEDGAIEKHPDWPGLERTADEDEHRERVDLYAGIDVARKRDFTVIWLWRRQAAPAEMSPEVRRRNWSLRCAGVIEMGNAPFAEQQEAIRRVLGLRNVRRCCIDATGMGLPLAEWAQDEFGRGRVEALCFTTGLKAQMAGQLRRLAEEGRLRIPADETIRNDWHSVQRVVGAGGELRLSAARTEGGHADRFWAAAMAAHAVDSGASGPVEGFVVRGDRGGRRGMW